VNRINKGHKQTSRTADRVILQRNQAALGEHCQPFHELASLRDRDGGIGVLSVVDPTLVPAESFVGLQSSTVRGKPRSGTCPCTRCELKGNAGEYPVAEVV
jgi:hypothetical protein